MTNKEYRKLYMQQYRKNNPEYRQYSKEKAKEHYNENKEQHKQITKNNANSIPAGIYMIKNKITGESYIGQSIQPYRRRTEHFSKLTKNYNQITPPRLQSAIKQHGKICFVFGVLEYCSKEELLAKEKYYIDLYKPEYNAN
jgi:hypothetical protein